MSLFVQFIYTVEHYNSKKMAGYKSFIIDQRLYLKKLKSVVDVNKIQHESLKLFVIYVNF